MTLGIGFNSTPNILALYYDGSDKNNGLYMANYIPWYVSLVVLPYREFFVVIIVTYQRTVIAVEANLIKLNLS